MSFATARCRRVVVPFLALLAALPCAAPTAWAAEPDPLYAAVTSSVPGGLCVQVGARDLTLVSQLAGTGRFLVHVVDDARPRVAAARNRLRAAGQYGLVAVEYRPSLAALPYAENLVNVLVISAPRNVLTPTEAARVLCPGGVLLAAADVFPAARLAAVGITDFRALPGSVGPGPEQSWGCAAKAWPPAMDQWTHPRHSATGNAVSGDTVVGPPRRIRWLAGPWEEVSNMVSGGGRNYYGGLLARDGFNGLRLWQRQLSPSPARGGFTFRLVPGSVAPVADQSRVFVVDGGVLRALDGGSGSELRSYPDAGRPRRVLVVGSTVLSVTADSVRALDVNSGELRWRFPAAEPRHVVAGDGVVGLIHGQPRRGDPVAVAALELQTGEPRWQRPASGWAARVTGAVYDAGRLAFETSTLNDEAPGNAVYLLSAQDGATLLTHEFPPGMNHMRQARPLFVRGSMWILRGGKIADKNRQKPRLSAIDPVTGEETTSYAAGLAHCFPPVATVNYLFSGEMDLTDLRTGAVDANQITKASCSRDGGWMPANGLINVAPKHCVCWPMVRGYAALVAARPGPTQERSDDAFVLEKGKAVAAAPVSADDDWPCYRHDAWRRSATSAAGPAALHTAWTVDLGQRPDAGAILQDWAENPFAKGPVTAPVIARGLVFVARPDAQEVVALAAADGSIRWRFTAAGRVDTPPTVFRGLCLFGSRSGHVYALRVDTGELVWRLCVDPTEERIVTYGQLESALPVPGSVLVIDGILYAAAGRHSFADGGIRVFAVEPETGAVRWVRRLDSVPQRGFYESSAMEFDNFDLLSREGRSVAMSRWLFDRGTGQLQVKRWDAFARLTTDAGAAMVPRGCWSYAPRHQKRTKTHDPKRPLVVFRGSTLFGCSEERRSIYRRDFRLDAGEKFETRWITGWAAGTNSQHGELAWPSQRLADGAVWKTTVAEAGTVDAMVLTRDRLFLGLSTGALQIRATAGGGLLAKANVGAPVWDGLAAAGDRLFLTTAAGKVFCLQD